MKLNLYQIDAFTNKVFGGNPACVVPLTEWLPDSLLLKIAKENAVPETAFFVDRGGKIDLRWFTPDIEMDLCGHATLATAHALKAILDYPHHKIRFETVSGELSVTADGGMYYLFFKADVEVVDGYHIASVLLNICYLFCANIVLLSCTKLLVFLFLLPLLTSVYLPLSTSTIPYLSFIN